VCAALVGLVASLTLYDSLFVRAGALGALCPLRGEQKANMIAAVVADGAG